MNEIEDDDLGVDLEAWQPPPVPGGIANAVIARMGQEHTSITQITAVPEPRRRWWIVGVTAAAIVASGVAAVAIVGMTRPPKSGQGTVFAEEPQQLEIGPTSAVIDTGTRITWRREKYQLTATQNFGAATWRVDDEDTLTLGAVVASIEASNASLRVEVTAMDDTKKTVGTAALVALVTVIVYDGTVRVTHDGKSVAVAAGKTYRVGENVIEDAQLTVGTDVAALLAELDKLRSELAELERLRAEHAQKQREIDELKLTVERAAPPEKRDVYSSPRPSRDDVDVPMRADACDHDALLQKAKATYSEGLFARALVEFQTAYRCKGDLPTLKLVFLAACRSKNVPAARRAWKQLPANARNIAQVCIAQGITFDQLEGIDTGKLRVMGKPAAKILIDGQEVGTTPLAIDLAPGRHKVTYVVGDDKHTFAVIVKAGETVTLHKDLE